MPAPRARAAYLLDHFWDGLDFRDTLRSHDPKRMELNFVNFISLFPHAEAAALPPAVGRLLERASADGTAFRLLAGYAEKYLSEPDSPMRNEDYYILFLEEWLQTPGLSEAERVRPAHQLKIAKKNRPGMPATDFAYVTREGRRQTLHGTQARRLLVAFYDPECSHCSEILKSLHASSLLSRLVDEKELAVLAVYTEGKRDVWDDTKASMPSEWIVGMDDSHIFNRELYDLPAMPVLYLLDKDKTVLLKDPDQVRLEAYLLQSEMAGE